MNLKQFKYVLVLSQEGSFSGAAESLNISQPSLSQYVKKIENEIGMPLFDRTGGNVRLTDAGHAYIEAGRRILDIEHQMQARIDDIRENKTGTLQIGTSPFRSASMMPAVAKQFKAKYPGVRLCIHEDGTAALMEGLEHGEYDLCVTMLPVNEQIFGYERILNEELLLAVPSSYPEFERAKSVDGQDHKAVDFKAIDGLGYVAITETQFMQKIFDSLCTKYGVRVNTEIVVKSLESQIEMVKAGLGVAMVSGGAVDLCRDGEVRFYCFKQKMPAREVVAVWRKDVPISKVSRGFIDTLRAVCAEK